jgi:hypothetical protein
MEGNKWPKNLPKIEDKQVALQLAATLLRKGFFHRSEKDDDKKGHLVVRRERVCDLKCMIYAVTRRCLARRYSRRLGTSPGCSRATWYGPTWPR